MVGSGRPGHGRALPVVFGRDRGVDRRKDEGDHTLAISFDTLGHHDGRSVMKEYSDERWTGMVPFTRDELLAAAAECDRLGIA